MKVYGGEQVYSQVRLVKEILEGMRDFEESIPRSYFYKLFKASKKLEEMVNSCFELTDEQERLIRKGLSRYQENGKFVYPDGTEYIAEDNNDDEEEEQKTIH